MYENVRANLRRLLNERNQTPADLVRATGLPRMHVYHICNGVTVGNTGRITAENIQQFATALGVDSSEITQDTSTLVETSAPSNQFTIINLGELPIYLNNYISKTGGGSAGFAQRSGLSAAVIDIVRITKFDERKPGLLEQSIEAAENLTDDQLKKIEKVLKIKIHKNNISKRLTRSSSDASTMEHSTVESRSKRQRTSTHVSQTQGISLPAVTEMQPSSSSAVSAETLPNDATGKLDQILSVLNKILEKPTSILGSNVPSSQPASSSDSEQTMPSSNNAVSVPQLPTFLPYMPFLSGNLYQLALLNQALQTFLPQLTSAPLHYPTPHYSAPTQPGFFGSPIPMQQGPMLTPQQHPAASGYAAPQFFPNYYTPSSALYPPAPTPIEMPQENTRLPRAVQWESHSRNNLEEREALHSLSSSGHSEDTIELAQSLVVLSNPNSPLSANGSPLRPQEDHSSSYLLSTPLAAAQTRREPEQSTPLLGFSLGSFRR